MKKTLNINLAGYPFTIDEDAYNLLKDYLDTIRYAFDTNEDTGEIATDIENRVAEILLEKENRGFRIVTKEEISKVIERIGKPSEFIELKETVEESLGKEKINVEETREEKIAPPPYEPYSNLQEGYIRKKLYRDPRKGILGGVCAGLAYYLQMDVTVVRLLTVLLFFLSATVIGIAYIIFWIVVPEARTPLQRMQMMGENPTVENIGKTVTETSMEEDPNPYQVSKEPEGFLSKSISILVKCLVFLGLIITAPLIIALAAALIGCIIAVFVIAIGIVSGGMFDSFNEGLMVFYILLAVIGGVLTVGVPLGLLIRKLWKKNDTHYSQTTQRSILIIWLVGIAMVSVFTVKAVKKAHQIDRHEWELYRNKLDDVKLEKENVESIKIDKKGVRITTKDGKKIKISSDDVELVDIEDSSSFQVETEVQDITDSIPAPVIDEVKIKEVITDSIK